MLRDDAAPVAVASVFLDAVRRFAHHAKRDHGAGRDDDKLRSRLRELVPPEHVERFISFIADHTAPVRDLWHLDDLYASLDRAVDAISPGYRRQHGIYFTDRNLARFFKWLAREHLGDVGQTHVLLDPCCGAGNLISNAGASLEFQRRVIVDTDPELLRISVERSRYDGAAPEAVPLVAQDGAPLNFIAVPVSAYSTALDVAVAASHGTGAPSAMAIICNPPYRSNDDQSAPGREYSVDDAILEDIGRDAAAEQYCCFLARVVRLLSMRGDERDIALLVTKASWLTNRPMYQQLRKLMLGSCEMVMGFLVAGNEFFDVRTPFPVALTAWRFVGTDKLDPRRTLNLVDLTTLTRRHLASVEWGTMRAGTQCKGLLTAHARGCVSFDAHGKSIREWSGCSRSDFNRDKTKAEANDSEFLAGLPFGDKRHRRRKRIGHADGAFVGFMDDLTPCRVRRATNLTPHFHLDSRFMRVRRFRCFSGPADNRSYAPETTRDTERLFVWYALGRSLAVSGYPVWADAFEIWPVRVSPELLSLAFAITYADNECVDVEFPADNPVANAPRVRVSNPMTPLNKDSFWSRCALAEWREPAARALIATVGEMFQYWSSRVSTARLTLSGHQRYVVAGASRELGADAGIVQIREFAREAQDVQLLDVLRDVEDKVRRAKMAFAEQLSEERVSYWYRPS